MRFRTFLHTIALAAALVWAVSISFAFAGSPAGPPVGINLGGSVPFDPAKLWASSARAFRPWKPIATTAPLPLPLSPAGYPLADATTSSPFFGYPAGIYKLRYDGSGTISVSGRGGASVGPITAGSDGIHRADVTIPGTAGQLILTLTGVDPGDPTTDLRLVRPGYDPENPPTFAVDSPRRMRPFACVRAMAFTGTNTCTVREWTDRVKPTDYLQVGPNGAAYEYAVDLANLLGRDLWLNVPHTASDDFVTKMAALVHARLAPTLNVYVEHSNEAWNTAFPQFAAMLAAAKADPSITAVADLGKVAQWNARRTVYVGRAWKAEFGSDAGRVRVVLGGQSNTTSFAKIGLAYLATAIAPPSVELWGVNIGPYVQIPASVDVAGLTLDGLFAAMTDNLNAKVIPGVQAHATLAQQYGIKLAAYEGGQSLIDVRRPMGVVNHDVKLAAQLDRRMGQLHRDLLTGWASAGGDLFCMFGPPSSVWDQNGYWGLLPNGDIDQPGGAKWDAVLGMVLPAGDVDLDGQVDYADYLVIRSNMGTDGAALGASPAGSGPGPFWREQGDLNGDGNVDASDVAVWLGAAKITDVQRQRVQASLSVP